MVMETNQLMRMVNYNVTALTLMRMATIAHTCMALLLLNPLLSIILSEMQLSKIFGTGTL